MPFNVSQGRKSALSGRSENNSVNKQQQQPSVKHDGWMCSKAEPLSVHLPKVLIKPKTRNIGGKKFKAPLSFDDLPSIRLKVRCFHK